MLMAAYDIFGDQGRDCYNKNVGTIQSAKSHGSSRTTVEWVMWAKNEGFDEIEDTNADKATPGKVRFYENISQAFSIEQLS